MNEVEDQSLALPGLVGEWCDSIWFVSDYVIVILENRTITCVTDPQIEVAGATYRLPEPGSRDALCALIGKSVVGAVQLETGTVEIEFTEGLILRVSPWTDFPAREFIYIAKRNP